jgi:hypothetical protein
MAAVPKGDLAMGYTYHCGKSRILRLKACFYCEVSVATETEQLREGGAELFCLSVLFLEWDVDADVEG